MATAKQQRKKEDPLKRKLETIAGFIGALLAIATLSVIAWDGITDGDGPAVIAVDAGDTLEHAGGFVLEIAVRNEGDRTATGVEVEGELREGEEVVATSTTTFDFLPDRSERRGGLFFSVDPRLYDIEVRAHGYAAP